MNTQALLERVRSSQGDLFVLEVPPCDIDMAVAHLADGANFLAVRVTDRLGCAMFWWLLSTRRVIGFGADRLSPGYAAGRAAIWLNLRRPEELRVSPAWKSLLGL